MTSTVALSFNASPGLILDRRFSEELQDQYLPIHRLVVEITEHAVVDRYEDLMATLAPLRAQGGCASPWTTPAPGTPRCATC